ncbi:hypothetical protein EDB86DRAFT_3095863 [Lactarius hatsudake]|nr:hypothetical protein EDB86DRAFT_3095863 [Lactarius hatsudake]
MDTADDPDVRQAALYHLTRQHLYEEMKEMECLQFPDNPDNRWLFKFPRTSSFVRLFSPSYHTYVDPHFHDNERWVAWAFGLHDIVMEWDGFDRWDWDGLLDVESLKSLSMLSICSYDLHRLIIHLLAFLIHSFVMHLGYYLLAFRQDYVYAADRDTQPAKQVASSTAHRNARATSIPLHKPPHEVRTKTTKQAQCKRKRRTAPAVHPKK